MISVEVQTKDSMFRVHKVNGTTVDSGWLDAHLAATWVWVNILEHQGPLSNNGLLMLEQTMKAASEGLIDDKICVTVDYPHYGLGVHYTFGVEGIPRLVYDPSDRFSDWRGYVLEHTTATWEPTTSYSNVTMELRPTTDLGHIRVYVQRT